MNRIMQSLTIKVLIAVTVLFAIVGCASAGAPMTASDVSEPMLAMATASADDAMAADEAMEMDAEGEIGETSLGERKIIREATLRLEAADVTDVLNWATALSVRSGGYTTHSNSWMANERQHASFSFAVPVERFEETMEQTRSLGKVLSENVSTRDVTAQYVDIAARIENLEVTTERVRSFLLDTTSVKQTLEVNRELTRLEGELNSLKGQRNVLSRQTSFSTIHLEITPIPLPLTTAEVVETVKVWTPVATFNNALAALLSVLQIFGNAAIWLVVVGGPVLLVLALLWAILRRLRPFRRTQPAAS